IDAGLSDLAQLLASRDAGIRQIRISRFGSFFTHQRSAFPSIMSGGRTRACPWRMRIVAPPEPTLKDPAETITPARRGGVQSRPASRAGPPVKLAVGAR